MTLKDGIVSTGWTRTIGFKVPLALVSLLLLFVIWESSPQSFLSSYSSLSTSQIQTYFTGRPLNEDAPPTHTSSTSTPGSLQHDSPVVPAVHTDSPGGEDLSSEPQEPKNRPVETVIPDPELQQESPINVTTTETDSTAATSVNSTLDAFAQEDTQLVQANNTAVLDSNSNLINETSSVFVEEDTQLVEEKVDQVDPQPLPQSEEKYIVPLLSYQVGTGNQLMEYKSAATIARAINRTLCLIPFFGGPDRHFGYLGNRHSGLIMEDRYDVEVLSKYVKVASMDECIDKCERRLDVHWRLKNSRPPHWQYWFNDTPHFSIDLNRQYSKWSSSEDVSNTLMPNNEPKCAGLGGLFPGLRWRGVMYAASTYMQHSKRIMKAADIFQARAFGSNDHNFLSVHWRFEESNCKGHPLGLCFSRCTDGAVISNGRASETWNNMTLEGKRSGGRTGFNGVFVSQTDVSNAIYDRAVEQGVRNVYLATDGWLRGNESRAVLKWVVDDLRRKGFTVSGLWMVGALPNFADGFYVHPANIAGLFGLDPKEVVSNHMIALVEQELCLRSSVFLGSGQSSWSLAVADTRRGRRCKEELINQLSESNLGTSPEAMEQAVIDKILTIQFTAGPTCRGSFNATMQKWEDEAPDGWLDYDSCEARLLKGVGECRRITV